MRNRRGRTRGTGRGDAGIGMVEVVVSIALIGTIVLSALAATWTNVRTANLHRDSVIADNLLRSSAESILSSATTYVDCATPSTYAPQLASVPSGKAIVTISDIDYWDGSAPAAFTDSCGVDHGAVAIELTATLASDGSTIELVVVKRRSQ